MPKELISRLKLLSISFIVLLFDQATKIITVKLLPIDKSIILIPNLIRLRVVENTGAAFSLFSNSTHILSLLSLLVSIFLFSWIYNKPPTSKTIAISISFLLGGTLGNGIDRWGQGFVYDFIELVPIHFPIFNLADIAINFAVILILIDTFKLRR